MCNRLLLTCAAALALVLALPAQDSKPAHLSEVVAKLESNDLPTVAWGAHLAAEHTLNKAIPAIRAALVRFGDRQYAEIEHLGMALLDSLIRLEARVPAKELEAWLEGYLCTPVLILLARQPKKAEQLLLRLFRSIEVESFTTKYLRAACGNLLATCRSGGFAHDILREMEVSLTVHVRARTATEGVDERKPVYSWQIGCSCGGLGTFYVVPRDYPPVGVYYLSSSANKNCRVLSRGPANIFYERKLEKNRRYPQHRSFSITSEDTQTSGWLASMLGVKGDQMPARGFMEADIKWRDAGTYLRQVENERLKAAGGVFAIANLLMSRGILSKDQASNLSPRITIDVEDHRWRGRPRLPRIAGIRVRRMKE